MSIKFVSNLILTSISLLALSGCAVGRSRTAAQNGEKIVKQFQLSQQQKVAQYNARYHKHYLILSRELASLLREDAQQGLDLDALQISDALTKNWKDETLPATFRNTFLDTVRVDYNRIRSAEKILDDARNSYARSYQDVSVPIGLLKQIDEALTALGSAPNYNKDLAGSVGVIWNAVRNTAESKMQPAAK